ncbi:MAG TPA: pitrilysin family protein [Pyrinomonadaceae bacterium]|nr:pitrilysin family protein [Pyrinomonadaceae bacterium]
MIRQRYTPFFFVMFAAVMLLPMIAVAQGPAAAPRQEKLLNGMKVLLWNRPAEERITIRLRIHSGAAFDPQEKEGVLHLLADSFFPSADSKSFFAEELGGSLEIETNYDFIQINAEARNSDLIELLETLSQAIINPSGDKETVAVLKKALAERVSVLEKDPAYLADRAVARRLFGTFPYGRPHMGSVSSIERIDFADLVFAKGRLLTADNATMAISGNFDPTLTFRAVRRFFGGWQKSDRRVPATFRQPDPPAADVAVVDSPVPGVSEFRAATRGVARNDPDYFASEMLRSVLNERQRQREGAGGFVRFESHILPGAFVFGTSQIDADMSDPQNGQERKSKAISDMLGGPIREAEFAKARTAALDRLRASEIDLWLDLDTFRLSSVKTEFERAQSVRLSDLQRIFERILKQPTAYVHVVHRTTGESVSQDTDQ